MTDFRLSQFLIVSRPYKHVQYWDDCQLHVGEWNNANSYEKNQSVVLAGNVIKAQRPEYPTHFCITFSLLALLHTGI